MPFFNWAKISLLNLLTQLRLYLELIRFSHTLFALPFAAFSAAMAWTVAPFRWLDLLGFLFCMVFARSSAMAFNRLVDWRYDAQNPRTANRHLPRGLLTPVQVAAFTIVSALGFILSTLLFLPNRWPIVGAVPILALLWAYSYTKRFTWLSHIWLGTCLALAPVAAWVAITASFAVAPFLLALAVVFWVAGFDVIYACQDYEFDRKAGLKSLPARFGIPRALRTAAGLHAGMLITLAFLPLVFPSLGSVFWLGVGIIAGLVAYEHSLVRPTDLTRVNDAFFTVNAIVSITIFLMGLVDLWLF